MLLALAAALVFSPTVEPAAQGVEWNLSRSAQQAVEHPSTLSGRWLGTRSPRWSKPLEPTLGETLVFDGYDGGLSVPDSPELRFRETLSIETVFAADWLHGFAAILWKGERLQSGVNRISYWFGTQDDRLIFQYLTPGGEWVKFTEETTALRTGAPYHVFLRFDRGALTGQLNGRALRFQRGGSESKALTPADGTPLWIGQARASFGFRGQIFKGGIARVRLSASDTKPTFEVSIPPPAAAVDTPRPAEPGRPGWSLAVLSAMEKVIAPMEIPTQDAPAMAMNLAGREYESAQLVLSAVDRPCQLRISLEPLVAELSGEAFPGRVSLSRVGFVKTLPPRYDTSFVGEWPDPLWPLGRDEALAVNAGVRQPVWVTVSAPHGTPAGVYRGALVVVGEGRSHRVPLTVRVRSFSLPERLSLPVSFSFDEALAARYYGQKALTPDQCAAIYRVLTDYRLGVADIYARDGYPRPEDYESLAPRGISSLSLTSLSKGNRLTQERSRSAFLSNVAAARKAGLVNRAFVYGYDEITFKHDLYALCREDYALAHQLAPDVLRMMTAAPIAELEDVIDIWTIPLSVWHESMAGPIRDRGQQMWFYTAGEADGDFPDLLLDQTGVQHRILFWMLWKYRADGYLLWRINRGWDFNVAPAGEPRWPERPWEPRLNQARSNCNGNFLWPHPDPSQPPLASVRMEIIRDGLEDHEYFHVLARQVRTLQGRGSLSPVVAQRVAAAEECLRAAEGLIDTPRSYTESAIEILERRRAIGDAIESLQADAQP